VTPTEIADWGRGATPRPPPVALLAAVHRAWPWTRGVVLAFPGTILVGPAGETIRLRADGGADELLAVPRRWSVSADPSAAGMRSTTPRGAARGA
jgi:hypothetical protein